MPPTTVLVEGARYSRLCRTRITTHPTTITTSLPLWPSFVSRIRIRTRSFCSFPSHPSPSYFPSAARKPLCYPQPRRWVHYRRFDGGSDRRNRSPLLDRIETLIYLWKTSPAFRYLVFGVGGGGAGFYVYNLEDVPVSGRRRFNCISAAREEKEAKEVYASLMHQYRFKIIPEWHPVHRQVQAVLDRLIPISGLKDQKWEIHVIDSDEVNAFVLPGGKVFVFSGILPVCKTPSGIAAVLGHEIAHNVAHHAGERLSRYVWLLPLTVIFGLFFDIDASLTRWLFDLTYLRPGSRKEESEADQIGLYMMAQACYDPAEAAALWERMADEERKQGAAVPAILSTHPSSRDRGHAIQQWLPEARRRWDASECVETSGWVEEWRRVKRSFEQGFSTVGAKTGTDNGTRGSSGLFDLIWGR